MNMSTIGPLILSAIFAAGAVFLAVTMSGCSNSTVTGNKVEIHIKVLPLTP